MFENVTVVGGPLVLSSQAELDEAEAQLGIRFPFGYREYVTRFGEGVLGGASTHPAASCPATTTWWSGGSGSTSIGFGMMAGMC